MKSTNSDYINQLNSDYGSWGKVYTLSDFLGKVKKNLDEKDFKRENSRLVFCVCPDDINRLQENDTIENGLKKVYNGEFHMGGLGAYPMGGVSGIIAASHHPPDNFINGNRTSGNLVFFISPHFGLIEKNDFIYGKIIRPGQEKITSSCGAIMGFLDALKQAGSPENFKIAPDTTDTDPTRIVLHKMLINKYNKELKDILAIDNENHQVIEMFKLNYELVMKKVIEMINEFIEKEKEHFKGKISVIGGITVNIPKKDLFILKEIVYPKN
jgi:hypothetical protein